MFNIVKTEILKSPDIDVIFNDDKKDSWITGLEFLFPNKLLMTDYNNHCLKSVNTSNPVLREQVGLPSAPWDIAVMPKERVVVTLPKSKKIQIISCENLLKLENFVTVNGTCYGIASTTKKLFISFIDEAKVEIMSHDGIPISVVNSEHLFTEGGYLAALKECDTEVVYVANQNKIVKISMEGALLSITTNNSCSQIQGLASVGNGQVLISNLINSSVDLVTENTFKTSSVLTRSNEIESPQALCYYTDKDGQKILCVSSHFRNIPLKVYNLRRKYNDLTETKLKKSVQVIYSRRLSGE